MKMIQLKMLIFLNDLDSFYSFTVFFVSEFEKQYDIVHDVLEYHRKGPNSRFTSKDLLFLLLYYFRRHPKYETLISIYHISESTFKGLLKNYLPKLLERL